jgi:hypothetical protein
MATKHIHRGVGGGSGAAGNGAGLEVDTTGVLVLDKGADWKGNGLASAPGYEPVPVNRTIIATASFTLTPADNGAVIICDSTTSIVAQLPATRKGLRFTLVVKQLTAASGHAFSPASVDYIAGNGLTNVDNQDIQCTAASDRVGDMVEIVGDGVDGWFVTSIIGTWAKV